MSVYDGSLSHHISSLGGLEVWQPVTQVWFHGFGEQGLGSRIAVAISSTYFVGRVHIHVGHD